MADQARAKPIPTLPDGRPVTSCLMPATMPAREETMFRRLHGMFCARRGERHDCSGRLTVDRNGVTLSCPLCGDQRNVYGQINPPQDQ